jgi:thioredoxin reductase (NADPH)
MGQPRECYVKVLVNKADNEKVVGFHICAPNAGEVT